MTAPSATERQTHWMPGDKIIAGAITIRIPHEYRRNHAGVLQYRFTAQTWDDFFGELLRLRTNPNCQYLQAARKISRRDWPNLQHGLLAIDKTTPEAEDCYVIEPVALRHIAPLLSLIKDLPGITADNPLSPIKKAISMTPQAEAPQTPPPSPARWYPILIGLALATFAVGIFGPPSCIPQSHKPPIKDVKPEKPQQKRQSQRSTGLAANPASMRAFANMRQHGRV